MLLGVDPPQGQKKRASEARPKCAPPEDVHPGKGDAVMPIADVRGALRAIPNNRRDYDWWLRVGMAVYVASGGHPEAFDAWDNWSSQSAVNDHAVTRAKWASFASPGSAPREITAGTLVWEAQQCMPGWTAPSRFCGGLPSDAAPDGCSTVPVEDAAAVLPFGFSVTEKGLTYTPSSEQGKDPAEPIWVSDAVQVVGEAADASGYEWAIVLRWYDRGGQMHEWVMPRRLLHSDGAGLAAEFEARGLRCSPSRMGHDLLKRALAGIRTMRRLRAVERGGWHLSRGEAPAFMLPTGESFGPRDHGLILRGDPNTEPAWAEAGALAEWQAEVAHYAVGNHRLALALSAAFAGPFLDITGEASGGFHLVGRSQSGKTTALLVAGSVWGRGSRDGNVRTWRATSNGLEGIAAETTDALLLLDEMGQADGREIGDVVYMLANEAGKARASRLGDARRRKSWRVLFLSTGEISLSAKLSEANRREMAGLSVRLINIPADAGVGLGLFQTLHGFPSAAALAEHLRAAARRYHGVAARALLTRLASDRAADSDGLRETVIALRDHFMESSLPGGADGQVRSVAGRFSLAAAAGEFATQWGVLPWQAGEATEAARACLGAWLAERGTSGASEDEQAVAAVRRFIEAHGHTRFAELDQNCGDDTRTFDEDRTFNRAGWRRLSDGGRWEYLILPSAWDSEVCKGIDPRRAARVLADRELLLRPSSGHHLSDKVRVPGHGRPRVYVVSADILEGGD